MRARVHVLLTIALSAIRAQWRACAYGLRYLSVSSAGGLMVEDAQRRHREKNLQKKTGALPVKAAARCTMQEHVKGLSLKKNSQTICVSGSQTFRSAADYGATVALQVSTSVTMVTIEVKKQTASPCVHNVKFRRKPIMASAIHST